MQDIDEKFVCCKNCVFYENSKYEGEGTCRRDPPAILESRNTQKGFFPIVLEKDWCGEFVPKHSIDDPEIMN